MRRVGWVLALMLLIFAVGAVTAGAQKNIVSMSLNQEIGTIDPAKVTDWTEAMVMVNLYDSLVTPRPDGTMTGLIAREWEISADGLEYVFKLHRGIKFHDGSELTAEDVKFSLERVLALKQGYSWLWADIVKDVVVRDDYTVAFTLNEPFSPFLSTLPWLAIVNKDLVLAKKKPGNFGEYGDYAQDWMLNNDAGSGAYMFKSWTRGNEIVFAKFDDYFLGWREGAIDEVRAKEIAPGNDATVISEMKTGALTIADHYRSLQTYEQIDRLPNASVKTALSGEALYLKINTQKAPVDNVHVRRAISYAFDYQTFIEQIDPGAKQLRGPIPDTIAGHNPNALMYNQDLNKAREELAKSGYRPGELTINLCYVDGFELEERLALLFQVNLAQIGINVVLQPETWGRITDLAASVETTPHLTAVFSAANYPDPDNYLYTAYHSSAAGTWMSMEWLQDPELDKLIERSRVTVDQKERNELFFEIQDRLTQQATDIFIYALPKRYGMQDYLHGFEFVPVMSFEYDFHKMYIKK